MKRAREMRLSRAFWRACATAWGSLSSPRTSLAPRRRAASARTPVPVPASSNRQLSRAIPRNLFQQTKGHRGRRMFARPKRARRGNDEQRHVSNLRRTRRLTYDFEATSDPDRRVSFLFLREFQPIARQNSRDSTKLTHQFLCPGATAADHLHQRAYPSRT